MKTTSTTRPQLLAVTKGQNEWFLTVCYNIDTVTNDGETAYEYDSATVKTQHKPTKDYPTLVAAIVRTRYSADDVEAIVQNHLNNLGNEDEEHLTEWEDLQDWRTEAKRIAREYLNIES
ncbi:MAG: hypothetical protein IJS63_09300 [Bacteroidaceae bacterium]|nr:hypothetical protein [Bacteroidaceae bacterium]